MRDTEAKVQKIIGFRVAAWPPKKGLGNTKPIGLTYHIQKAFRYSLEAYISEPMKGLYQRTCHHGIGLFRQGFPFIPGGS